MKGILILLYILDKLFKNVPSKRCGRHLSGDIDTGDIEMQI